MSPTDWIQTARDLGIPVVMLAAMCFGTWKTLQWSAVNIALPVRDRAFKFIDKLEESIVRVEHSVVGHSVILGDLQRYQVDSAEARKAAKAVQEQILATLKENGITLKEFVCRAEEFACGRHADVNEGK